MPQLPAGVWWPTMSGQMDLIAWGRHSAETRAESARAARPQQPARQRQVMEYVAACGPTGACRHEIADAMGWPIQSVTSPVLSLLRDGRLQESGDRRLTRYGRSAAVLLAAQHEPQPAGVEHISTHLGGALARRGISLDAAPDGEGQP